MKVVCDLASHPQRKKEWIAMPSKRYQKARPDRRMNHPEFYLRRMDDQMREPTVRALWAQHAREAVSAQFKKENSSRGLNTHYEPFFGLALHKAGLGNSMLGAFASIPRRRGERFSLIEDGPGTGKFLAEFKYEMTRRGILTHTIAVGLHHLGELRTLAARGKIDEVEHEFGELFVPKRKVHAIVSMFGSLVYSPGVLKKNMLLKMAYSLKKGGLLLYGYTQIDGDHPFARVYTPKSLSGKPVLPAGVRAGDERDGIERSFKKRGFYAKFVHIPSEIQLGLVLPEWALVVRRDR